MSVEIDGKDYSLPKLKSIDTNFDLYDMLGHSSVTSIFGRRDSGKTALGCLALEHFHRHNVRCVILTFKQIPKKLIPEWLINEDVRNPNPEWPNHSVYFIDDIHLLFHARTYRVKRQIGFDDILSICRHNDTSFLMSTQFSRREDVNYLEDSDNVLFKNLSQNQLEYDRPQMRKRLLSVYLIFQALKARGEDLKTCFYAQTEDINRMNVNQPLPSFWSSELSTYLRQKT